MTAERQKVLLDGLACGFVGYGVVAVVVSVIDLASGRSPFFTVSMLGESVYYGLRDPAKVTVWPGAVYAYNGLHLVTFIALGAIASWLAAFAERGPEYWYGALVLFLLAVLHVFGVILYMTEGLRSAISAVTIAVATIAAAAAMVAFLVHQRPRLRYDLGHWQE